MTGRVGCGLALGVVLLFQQKGPPPNRKAYDPFHDPNVQKSSDDSMGAEQKKRLEAERLAMVTEEKQRVLARDAEELVRMVTALQARVETDEAVLVGNGMRKQVEAIEKMARSMKKRAKGEQP